jgi:hypothetical protein
MSKVDAWRQLREEILQNLDIRRAYEEYGVKFTGKISASNWAECHAFGREDKSPSAAVNLTTGVYKDFAGDRASIFDFMVANNISPSWQEAQEELAKKCGLAKKIPKKAKAKRTQDVLGFTNTFNIVSVVPLARMYGIEPRIIAMTGARIARYPANAQEPQIVCAFPIYSPISMLETPPDSYVLQSGSGKPIMVYQGPDAPQKPEKRIVVGTTGILNRFALENWEGAERIYKVEGPSDMLAMQYFIPEELWDKHLVITNACGCDDGAPAWELANHCVGKEIIIIHDADVPGQFGTGKDQSGGAQRWIKAIKSTAKILKNVQLPYEIAAKHGKDLRNWIAEEGRKYSDLLELVTATKDEVTGTVETGTGATSLLTETAKILNRLELVVLGHDPERSVKIHLLNQRLRRHFEVPDISKYNYIAMLVDIGDLAQTEIDPSPEPSAAKISVNKLREAIAYEASERRLSRTTAIGTGFWGLGDKLIMVGAGEWCELESERLNASSFPLVKFGTDSRVVDFGDVSSPWYDRVAIEAHLPAARNPTWRTRVFDELTAIFKLWNNWDLTHAPELLAGLALCSWIQDVWSWRPWIALNGESNSAKSTLLKFLSEDYFGTHIANRYDNTTEAGIRQSIGTSSRIILLDELEKSKEREPILQFLKSSGGGGRSARGTPGQKSIESQVKLMPWMASTEYDLGSETIRNRYLMFHMKSRLGKPFFRLPSKGECEELRNKSLAILLTVWRRAKELHQILVEKVSIEGVGTRFIENYSLPIAMKAAVEGMDDSAACILLRALLDTVTVDIQSRNIPEHETILTEILTACVQVTQGCPPIAVAEILNGQRSDELKALERHGLKQYIKKVGKRKYFFVGTSIKNLLRNTPQNGRDVTQILARIEGAISVNHKQRVAGNSLRGVSIPWEIVSPFLADDDADDFVPQDQKANSIAREIFDDDRAA